VADSVLDDCRIDGYAVSGAAIGAGHNLVLTRSTISNAHASATSFAPYVASVRGGAVWAYSATMIDSTISGVDISASSSDDGDSGAYGGGIYAFGGITMTRSRIENVASVVSGNFVFAFGGGAESVGVVALTDSTISGNTIDVSGARGESFAGGGGLRIAPIGTNTVSLLRSTISDNALTCSGACPFAYLYGGGIATYVPTTLTDATVSGNRADTGGGIRSTQTGSLALWNTTITNNSARAGTGISNVQGEIATESSIVADDIALFGRALEIETEGAVTGSHNLIESANVTLPPDTISADPMLAPLAANGGMTETHALLAGSPALDAGDNVLELDTDQRGGSFARVVGDAADIGAFESRPDALFSNGFDG
jgi:predicted outer membrane repeat protein